MKIIDSGTRWTLTAWEAAERAIADGWAVIPLVGKIPACKGGIKAATRDLEKARELFDLAPNATGVGGACDGLVVVDIDPRSGGQEQHDLPPTRVHWSGRGDGGHHLIYRLPEGAPKIKSGNSKLGRGVDVKTGAHSYIVLPGSLHPDTNQPYRSNDADIQVASRDLLRRLGGDSESKDGNAPTLHELLQEGSPEGGRNNWLTQVAGHYARLHHNDAKVYYAAVEAANRLLEEPLDDEEVVKISDSIWQAEQSNGRSIEFESLLQEASGWLVSGGDHILTLAVIGDGKKRKMVPTKLANFDLRVVGKLWDPVEEHWTYECDLHRENDIKVQTILLRSTDFGTPSDGRRALSRWALNIKAGIQFAHEGYDWCSRLMMYLDNQDAPTRTITPTFGWSSVEHGYVIGKNKIDDSGLQRCQQVVTNPELNWVEDSYGFAADQHRARQILTDVLHYQDPTVASLFASWWAACLVKQWIKPRVSLFPVMAIEAASGSGKTTGFFSLMMDLGGSLTGEGHYTAAVLRNRLASNLNGITWVDDMEDPTGIHEIIRILTGGGSMSKMSNNNVPQQYHLVGSLLLSGEALGLDSQKALRDRTVMLTPPPPHGRKSHLDPERSQWLDVVETRDQLARLGGGKAISGHFLQISAGLAADVARWFQQEREDHSGQSRRNDRDLVLLVGARVLQSLSLDPLLTDSKGKSQGVYRWVHDWVHSADNASLEELLIQSDGREVVDADNTLTTKLLPKYFAETTRLRHVGKCAEMTASGELVVHPARLADWWHNKNRGFINMRTESHYSLVAQLKQLREAYPDDVKSSQRRRLDGTKPQDPQVRCWVITGEMAEVVRSRVDYY